MVRLRRKLHILLVTLLAILVLSGILTIAFTLRSLAVQPTLPHLVSLLGQASACAILLFILRANLIMLWPPQASSR